MNECVRLWAPLDRDDLPARLAGFPDLRMPMVGGIDDLPRRRAGGALDPTVAG